MCKITKINKEKLDWLLCQNTNVMFELLKNHMEMSKILANEIMNDEVEILSGERYSHNKPQSGRYSRWGNNPGSIRIGSEKVPLIIPRIYDNKERKNKPLDKYRELKQLTEPSEEVLDKIILGLSQRDYERVSKDFVESFGLRQGSVSRMFIESSSKALEEFEKRDISRKDIIVLQIDGKSLRGEEIIICLGITIKGEKIVLGFAQSNTENNRAIKQLLRQLINRGLDYSKGILIVSDGSKAIKKAIKEIFGKYHMHQRCQWHKREDVICHLSSENQDKYRRKLQRAYKEPDYDKAKEILLAIREELKELNIAAVRSLDEGFEETLTLHKLKLIDKLGASLGTTNCIESLNSQLGRYLRKITRWKNSDQIYRWVAAGLMESERRMNKIRNYKSLITLRNKLILTLKIKINIKKLDKKAA
jgi:transposase-like protein